MKALAPFAAALCLAALPLVLPQYWLTLMNFTGLAAIVVLGLVLLTGVGGMTSFGQAAFVGISAYTTAWFTTQAGLSPWLTLPLSLAVTASAALLIGLLTLGLRGHYLPLSTLAWSMALFYLVGNLPQLGSHDGIGNLPPLLIAGHVLGGRAFTWLTWAAVGLAFLSARNLLDSRTGRALRALRGGRIMLQAFGADIRRLKLLVFVHAAVLAALSGWLYAHMMRFVSPTPFGISAGIDYLFMAVIGGAASLWGAIIGSGAVVVARDLLQDIVPGLTGATGATELLVFGLVVVLVLQRAPGGIAGRFAPPPRLPRAALSHDATPLPPRPALTAEPLLAAQGLTRRFGGLTAANDISLSVGKGRILGLIGPNGAGKSTVFDLLTGVTVPDAGRVLLAGQDITDSKQTAIARAGLARTFQHTRLRGDMTLLENVAIGAHARGVCGALASIFRRDRAEEARIFATARAQLQRLGLEPRAGVLAGQLSQGERRTAEIARALASDPAVLLLDEPAAGLRHAEKQHLAGLLHQLRAEGLAILIIEHDMRFLLDLVDRVVVLNFGQQIAEGTPDEVRANPAVQSAYLGEDEA